MHIYTKTEHINSSHKHAQIWEKAILKMIVILSGTGQSQPLNGYATSQGHYENSSSLNQDTPQTTKFESSTNYSLLSPENETISGADGGRVTNGGEEEYSLLDRGSGHGRAKTTASQKREQLDGYSRLFSN
jgi:hypothetical protein